MAVYVTGDTHGGPPRGPHSADGFMHRFSMASFPEQKKLGKDDYVIVLGDFGGVWGTDRLRFQETQLDRLALDWLEERPFTTLFVPGNHENYDRLTGCRDERLLNSWFYAEMPPEEKEKLRHGYPREPWHGGHVRVLRPSVLMLERGEIFDIGGKNCFAFGGAQSHDVRDGILDPADYPDEDAFKAAYAEKRGGLIRVRGLSWWEAEMPTEAEMAYGRENILSFLKEHDRIDFVITHDAPASDRMLVGFTLLDDLNRYLESLREIMPYDRWFYGHLHANRRIAGKHFLLYEQIVRIC